MPEKSCHPPTISRCGLLLPESDHMKCVQFASYGDPAMVLECVDVPEPGEPGVGQALVAVEFAPVNHNDLMIPPRDKMNY
jgi:D-arabinose 1-dehydrogenase-like Zn-dependent alcohol dehydrogenase